MGNEANIVECSRHGPQQACFVCQHLSASLLTGNRVGFVASLEDEAEQRPHAWCFACEKIRLAEGGEWNDRSETSAGITLICGACYDTVRALNEDV